MGKNEIFSKCCIFIVSCTAFVSLVLTDSRENGSWYNSESYNYHYKSWEHCNREFEGLEMSLSEFRRFRQNLRMGLNPRIFIFFFGKKLGIIFFHIRLQHIEV